MYVGLLLVIVLTVNLADSGLYSPIIRTPANFLGNILNYPITNTLDFFRGNVRRQCPVCDPSVYGYCTDKLFHDSCCCHNPNNPYDQLPYQCQFADCSFLHANTCQEHKLITACCCINTDYYKK